MVQAIGGHGRAGPERGAPFSLDFPRLPSTSLDFPRPRRPRPPSEIFCRRSAVALAMGEDYHCHGWWGSATARVPCGTGHGRPGGGDGSEANVWRRAVAASCPSVGGRRPAGDPARHDGARGHGRSGRGQGPRGGPGEDRPQRGLGVERGRERRPGLHGAGHRAVEGRGVGDHPPRVERPAAPCPAQARLPHRQRRRGQARRPHGAHLRADAVRRVRPAHHLRPRACAGRTLDLRDRAPRARRS